MRSYDPQIGRFLQNDPYDQFASGYVGMGNDPGNLTDEDGGFAGMTTANSMLLGAVGGAIVGGAIAGFSGGDPLKGALFGAVSGAGIGLLSTLKAGTLSTALNGSMRNANLNSLISFTSHTLNAAQSTAPIIEVGYTSVPTISYERTRIAAKIAGVLSAADGPIPFGEAAGLTIIIGAAIWDTYDNIAGINSASNALDINGGTVTIAEGLSIVAKFLDMAGKITNPNDEHHSDPKMYGGKPSQKTTKMLRELHKRLHKSMREFLRNINKKLLPGPGRKGEQIVENFGRKYILEQLAKFYRTPEAQKLFKEAADDFFKQHPGL